MRIFAFPFGICDGIFLYLFLNNFGRIKSNMQIAIGAKERIVAPIEEDVLERKVSADIMLLKKFIKEEAISVPSQVASTGDINVSNPKISVRSVVTCMRRDVYVNILTIFCMSSITENIIVSNKNIIVPYTPI